MAEFKFNRPYTDKQLNRQVKANEPVEMAIKRADEVVETVRKQAEKDERFAEYKDFAYERLDNPDNNPDNKAKDNKTKEADK